MARVESTGALRIGAARPPPSDVDLDAFYDGLALVAERAPGDVGLFARYHNDAGGLQAVTAEFAPDVVSTHTVHRGALGSTLLMTDGFGAAASSYRTDPWGRLVPAPSLDDPNALVFTGHQHDAATGLIYMKSRMYDPALGAFLTQDSYLGRIDLPASLHRYLYAYGNPGAWVDPDGRCSEQYEDSNGNTVSLHWVEQSSLYGGYGCSRSSSHNATEYERARVRHEARLDEARADIAARDARIAAWASQNCTRGFVYDYLNDAAMASQGRALFCRSAEPSAAEREEARAAFAHVERVPLAGVVARGIGAYEVAGTAAQMMAFDPVALYDALAEQRYLAAAGIVGIELLGLGGDALRVVSSADDLAAVSTRLADDAVELGSDAQRVGGTDATWDIIGEASPSDGVYGGVRVGDEVGGVVADGASRLASSPHYSVGYEVRLTAGTHYPGSSRSAHFQEANRQLHAAFEADLEFAASMETLYPGVVQGVRPGARGAYPRRAPTPDVTWHHAPEEGVLQLVPRSHHTAPGPVQQSLHPGGQGGMSIWGD